MTDRKSRLQIVHYLEDYYFLFTTYRFRLLFNDSIRIGAAKVIRDHMEANGVSCDIVETRGCVALLSVKPKPDQSPQSIAATFRKSEAAIREKFTSSMKPGQMWRMNFYVSHKLPNATEILDYVFSEREGKKNGGNAD